MGLSGMRHFTKDASGSSTRWFALAVAVVATLSAAGAHSLAWLSASGRVAVVAYRPPAPATPQWAGRADVDPTPTGSIPGSALVIRLR